MKKKLLNFSNKLNGLLKVRLFCRTFFFIFFSCFLFSSCTTLRNVARKGNPLKLHLYPAKKIPLMSTFQYKGEEITKKYNLKIEKNGFERFYTVRLNADSEEIEISIFNSQGERISNIMYRGNSLSNCCWEKKWSLSAEQTLNVFQCCFYDANDVAQMLNSINYRFSIENLKEDSEENRRIYNKRNCIIKITKKEGYIRCRNYEKKFILYLTEI